MERVAHNTHRWVIAGIGIMLMAGCQTTPVGPEPPAWLGQVPGGQHELCATGVSGPTYYSEDALVRSKAQAMTELSRTLEVKIKADMQIVEHGDSRGSDVQVVETAEFSSDVLLKQAQVKEQWIHPGGNVGYGVRGMVYTLVCMPLPR